MSWLQLSSPAAAAVARGRRATAVEWRVSLARAPRLVAVLLLVGQIPDAAARAETDLEIVAATVTPHVRAAAMRYRRPSPPDLAARVQLFLRNRSAAGSPPLDLSRATVRFSGQDAEQLLADDGWAWHDAPSAHAERELRLAPGEMTVWTFNGKTARWGVGNTVDVTVHDGERPLLDARVPIDAPDAWLSAVTFLDATGGDYRPDSVVIHLANDADQPLRTVAARIWLPESGATWRVLRPADTWLACEHWPADGVVPARDKGVLRAQLGKLPLTYAAVEVRVARGAGEPRSLFAHLRVKREAFDISGGWVGGPHELRQETFLKLLARLHVNTGHIAETPGYTDNAELYARYPLKYFHDLRPFGAYDTEAMLPRIHAVEFLGEPQYGGGRPVPPQECWRKLIEYAPTRLATSVTHSEENVWRYYAGLSDFPHYDAYRVSAPSPDAWRLYERWGERRIGWGAPLETIGDMCRSLRELNRPMPCAYWSQGPHYDWGVYDKRRRTSPTADELRMQAYHALSTRITSLYWFNLSLKSLLKFPDTWEALEYVGREIVVLREFYLTGDAYRHERLLRDGRPDWDLASIAAPAGALLFALDLDYEPDPEERVFRFGAPRAAALPYALPAYLRGPADVFRIDAQGVYDVEHRATPDGLEISDSLAKVGIYVATPRRDLRGWLAQELRGMREASEQSGFDPWHRPEQMRELQAIVDGKP